jgi:hypothetical protein
MSNIGVVRHASLLRRTWCTPHASALARLDLEHFTKPSQFYPVYDATTQRKPLKSLYIGVVRLPRCCGVPGVRLTPRH